MLLRVRDVLLERAGLLQNETIAKLDTRVEYRLDNRKLFSCFGMVISPGGGDVGVSILHDGGIEESHFVGDVLPAAVLPRLFLSRHNTQKK